MEKIKVKFVKPCFEICGDCKTEHARCLVGPCEMETGAIEVTSEELVESINKCEHIIVDDRQ